MGQGIYLAVLVFFPFVAGLLSFGAGRLCAESGKFEKSEKKEKTDGIAEKKSGKSEKIVGRAKKQDGQKNLRDGIVILSTVAEFAVMLALSISVYSSGSMEPKVSFVIPDVCGGALSFRLDGFRIIYGCVASFMWMMAAILSREYLTHHKNRNRYYLFLLWTLGATMGVFLSGNLYTTFIFFEIMSFTSYVWVAQEENRPALRAADTYLAVAVFGGLVMLMGIFLLYRMLGTLDIEELARVASFYSNAAPYNENRGLLYVAGGCMLVGFGAKAGAFPLHIWLPKAHPVAPAPASALLSGILTKTGIYGVLILSCSLFLHDAAWGALILVLGVITMFGGALLAVFSVDLKRTLACSSMSQIGFILVGIGMQGLLGEENALAVHGTFLHMVNHSLIKLVLFLAAGVIYMNAHSLDLNEIRGFGRRKPLLAAIFLVGALAIGGIPLFGGYISKTLLHESILEYGGGAWMRAVEYIFLLSGGLTVAYMTKLFTSIFMETNADESRQQEYDSKKVYMGPASIFALGGSAVVLFIWGLVPRFTMDRAAGLAQGFMGLKETGHSVAYFSLTNLRGALISIVIGALVYALVIRKLLMKREDGAQVKAYVNVWPKWLDLENLIYRPLLLKVFPAILGVLCRILDSFVDTVVVLLRKSVYRDSPLPFHRREGNVFTVAAGKVLNGFQVLGNLTWRRRNPIHRDYVHLVAMKSEEIKESNWVIQRSLSFGLLLICIGLALTLVYLILW